MAVEGILRKTAEAMRDPERVVLNSRHIFETAAGESTRPGEEACRACVLGHVRLLDAEELVGDIPEFECLVSDFTWDGVPAARIADRLDALADKYAQVSA